MADESAFGILAGVGVGGAWIVASGLYDRWFAGRSKLVADTQKERDGLSARQTALLDSYQVAKVRAEEDATRERARRLLVDTENDTLLKRLDDAGEDTRAWKSRARCLKHELENTRTVVNHLMVARGMAVIEWFDEELPAIDDIRADNIARAGRYAAWRKTQSILPSRAAAALSTPAVTAAIGQFLIPAEHLDE